MFVFFGSTLIFDLLQKKTNKQKTELNTSHYCVYYLFVASHIDTCIKVKQTMSGLRYPGGKTRAVKILSKYIPDDTMKVVSPFLGGGSFEIHLAKKGIAVRGYDILEPLVAYWKALLDHPDDLRAEVSTMHPITQEQFKQYQETLKTNAQPDELKRAALFFVLNRSSFSGTTMSGGFSKEAGSKRFTQSSIDRIKQYPWGEHMQVELGSFEDTIAHADPESVIFADPPYVLAKKLYGVNGEGQNIDHTALRDCIVKHKRWLITYDDCPLVRELYKDHVLIPVSWAYGMNASKSSKEILILSTDLMCDLWEKNVFDLGCVR